MANNFGPWSTTLDTSPGASLGTFWKRRLAMLPFAKHAAQRPSGRAVAVLMLFAAIVFAAPTLSLSLSPAAPPEIVPGSDSAPPSAAPVPLEPPGARIEKLPDAMPRVLPAVPVPGKPNVFKQPLALAEVTAAPLLLRGSLTIDPNRLARVRSLFAGEVTAIGKIGDTLAGGLQGIAERDLRQGDRVAKGQVLAVVWSKDLGEKKSDLADALLMRYYSEEELKSLMKLGVVAERQLREARKKVDLDEIAVQKVERTLRSWRVSDEEIDRIRREVDKLHSQGVKSPKYDATWAQFEIRAPLAGVVLEKNAVIGDLVDTKFDLFKIADLSKLAVRANVYEQDIPALKALSPERRRWSIHLKAEPDTPSIVGYFDTIGDVIDPNQHTSIVTGTVDNESGTLGAGQFITATIVDSQVMSIPAAALVVDGDGAKVWVEIDHAKPIFDWRRVQVFDRSAERVICQPFRNIGAEQNADTEPLRVGARVVLWGVPQPAKAKTPAADPKAVLPVDESRPLAEAIEAFNVKAASDPIGREQPPLTEDEVVAAILWSDLNKTEKVTKNEYRAFRQIADTRRMPKSSEFEVLTGFQPNDSVEFQAWSVRIRMPRQVEDMPGGTYAFSIRDRRIASRPIGDEERKVMKKWDRENHVSGFRSTKYREDREKAREIDESKRK